MLAIPALEQQIQVYPWDLLANSPNLLGQFLAIVKSYENKNKEKKKPGTLVIL